MRKRYIIPIMSLIAGLSLMAIDQLTPTLLVPDIKKQSNEVDFYSKQMTSRQYDESGKLTQVLMVSESTHYPLSDTLNLVEPRLRVTTQTEEQWAISADKGIFKQRSDELFLQDNVLISSATVNTQDVDDIGEKTQRGDIEIRSRDLHYRQDTRIATTDNEVKVIGPNYQINATGMTYVMDEQSVLFKSKVTTRYEPM